MRTVVIFGAVVLLATFAQASPLAVESKREDKPMTVVDIPAGLFANTPENPEKEAAKPQLAPVETPAGVDKVAEPTSDTETVTTTDDKEQGPSIFGIRFPSIVIIRRPSIFQDPFAGFQSPFFGGFNRRPIFSRPPPFVQDESAEVIKEQREPVAAEAQEPITSEQKQNETVMMNHVITRMHQQISNLFANLFNPQSFFMPRPSLPRPTFTRPSIFDTGLGDSSEFEDKVSFDKLPDNYSNSTSETKVIDGQLVTVNKTVHKISGNNSNGFFHFSVIKVKPSGTPLPTDDEKVIVPDATQRETGPVVIGSESVSTDEAKTPEMDPKLNEVDRPDEEEQVSPTSSSSKGGIDSGLL